MKNWKKYLAYFFAFILSALFGSFLVIYYTPYVMVERARVRTGLEYNKIKYREGLADETRRQVVMPSPDFLYAVAYYDLSEGPLQITSVVPQDNYWSLSLFHSNSNNFYVINDSEIDTDNINIILSHENQKVENIGKNQKLIYSSDKRGVLIIRGVVKTQDDFDMMEKVQKSLRLEKFKL